MTSTITIPLTRRDGITIARDAIRDVAERLDASGDGIFAEIYRAWDARLEAASNLYPDFQLTEAAGRALDELTHAAHRASGEDVETLAEWLDLLPRGVLALVDVNPVAYRSWSATRQSQSLANSVSTQAWDDASAVKAHEVSAA